MSTWSLTYQQNVSRRYHSIKYLSEFLPTRWRQKSTAADIWNKTTSLSPYVQKIINSIQRRCEQIRSRLSHHYSPAHSHRVAAAADQVTAQCGDADAGWGLRRVAPHDYRATAADTRWHFCLRFSGRIARISSISDTDTMRDTILTCAQKLTRVGLICRTEPTTKSGKREKKLKSKNTDMLSSIGKQSGESLLKNRRKATVWRI